jgi:hypothetical protein
MAKDCVMVKVEFTKECLDLLQNLAERLEDIECEIQELKQFKDHRVNVELIEKKVAEYRSSLVKEYCDALQKSGT